MTWALGKKKGRIREDPAFIEWGCSLLQDIAFADGVRLVLSLRVGLCAGLLNILNDKSF
jgi:hypothetical protein